MASPTKISKNKRRMKAEKIAKRRAKDSRKTIKKAKKAGKSL